MAKQLDVYRDWLQITETARPLNHYQLLRLPNFEDDPNKIRAHFHKMNSHVRKYLARADATEIVHALLDELTKAMLCLSDTRRKADYDASLGRTGRTDAKKRSLDEVLVGRKIISPEELAKAKNLANAIGVDLRDAVMQQKLAKPDAVMQAYADSLGLPFVELSMMSLDPELLPKLPAVLARQHSCAPLLIDDEKVVVASPNPLRPEVEDELRLRIGLPVRGVLCTPGDIHEVINKHYPREAAAAQMGVTSMAEATAKEAAKPKMDPAERKKRRQQITMVAFMMTFMVFALVGQNMAWGKSMAVMSFYLSGLAVASVAAAIGWFST